MEEILKCDNCNHSFSGTRIPLILGHCGHTYCKNCVDMRLLANTNGRQCAACQQYSTIQEIKPNIKILKALELINNQELVGAHEDIEGTKIEMGSIRSQNVVMPTKSAHTEITDYSRVYCYMHQERQIEYFCRNCHQLVCPKCMFKDHNGHEFAQLDDVTNVVK